MADGIGISPWPYKILEWHWGGGGGEVEQTPVGINEFLDQVCVVYSPRAVAAAPATGGARRREERRPRPP